jgi:hypothetical protein
VQEPVQPAIGPEFRPGFISYSTITIVQPTIPSPLLVVSIPSVQLHSGLLPNTAFSCHAVRALRGPCQVLALVLPGFEFGSKSFSSEKPVKASIDGYLDVGFLGVVGGGPAAKVFLVNSRTSLLLHISSI